MQPEVSFWLKQHYLRSKGRGWCELTSEGGWTVARERVDTIDTLGAVRAVICDAIVDVRFAVGSSKP